MPITSEEQVLSYINTYQSLFNHLFKFMEVTPNHLKTQTVYNALATTEWPVAKVPSQFRTKGFYAKRVNAFPKTFEFVPDEFKEPVTIIITAQISSPKHLTAIETLNAIAASEWFENTGDDEIKSRAILNIAYAHEEALFNLDPRSFTDAMSQALIKNNICPIRYSKCILSLDLYLAASKTRAFYMSLADIPFNTLVDDPLDRLNFVNQLLENIDKPMTKVLGGSKLFDNTKIKHHLKDTVLFDIIYQTIIGDEISPELVDSFNTFHEHLNRLELSHDNIHKVHKGLNERFVIENKREVSVKFDGRGQSL